MVSESPLNTVLYVKPDWDCAEEGFAEQWSRFLRRRNDLWRDRVHKEKILEDRSVILITDDVVSALEVAEDIKRVLVEETGSAFFAAHMVIDAGFYVRGDSIVVDGLDIVREEMEPAEIFISPMARKLIESNPDLDLALKPSSKGQGAFCRVCRQKELPDTLALFSFRLDLERGEYPPCFYCGCRRHPVGVCPSKKLVISPQASERLGHLPFEQINRIFSDFVKQGGLESDGSAGPPADSGGAFELARDTFYGSKRVFQLPFFRHIWDAKADSWDKIKKSKVKKEVKGGVIWMGTDCLRVSNLVQAEAFLRQAAARYEEDYRTHCALGFLHVEKNDALGARHYFIKALDRSHTAPQKIFVNLLICRLYGLEGYPLEAAEKIRQILKLDSNCVEAIYLDIVLKFKEGKLSEALEGLMALMERDRQYIVHALVDPELAPFGETIYPALYELYARVKEEAKAVIGSARNEYMKARSLIGENETKEVEALWSRITELSREDGIFAQQDMVQVGRALAAMSQKTIQIRKRQLVERLRGLHRCLEMCLEFIGDYRYPGLVQAVRNRVCRAEKEIRETRNMADSDIAEKFRKSFDRPPELEAELGRIESKLKRLDLVQMTGLFFSILGKTCLIYQSAVAVLAIVLFPVAAHYLNIFLPQHGGAPIENVWAYQKGILLVGGVFAAVSALLKAAKMVHKDERIPILKKASADDLAFSLETDPSLSLTALQNR
jgi:tetratricopeptide (TPR) repeat protein